MTLVEAGAADWFDVKGTPPKAKQARRLKDGTIGMIVGGAMLAILLLMGILVPLLSPYESDQSVDMPFMPPSSTFLFGSDGLGRDVFLRVFSSVYLDLGVAFLGVIIPFTLGTIIGIGLAMSRSKKLNAVVGSVIDGINAFPLLVLAIALIAILGPGLQSVVIALSLTNWARYARLSRTRAQVVKQQGYIEAAQTQGYSKRRILFKHLVPNVSSETTAYGLSDLILVILLIASLSFLGLGAQPPTPEWGAMISDGRPTLQMAWWPVVFPGLALCWAGVALSFIAEGVTRRDRDVKS
jgi:peptide/nickel transport system permease protein